MTKLTTCVLTTTLLFGMGTAYASNLDLEPRMNGAVSASGTFPTQEAENRFPGRAGALHQRRRPAGRSTRNVQRVR